MRMSPWGWSDAGSDAGRWESCGGIWAAMEEGSWADTPAGSWEARGTERDVESGIWEGREKRPTLGRRGRRRGIHRHGDGLVVLGVVLVEVGGVHELLAAERAAVLLDVGPDLEVLVEVAGGEEPTDGEEGGGVLLPAADVVPDPEVRLDVVVEAGGAGVRVRAPGEPRHGRGGRGIRADVGALILVDPLVLLAVSRHGRREARRTCWW